MVSAIARTRFGEYALARGALGAGLAVAILVLPRLLEGRLPRVVQLALAGGLLATPVASGHASVSGAVAFVADLAHVFAAAAWTGGLAFVVLALVLVREQRWPLASAAVPRFSMLAVGAVGALLVAGTVNGYLQVRVWHGLWETTYGRLLLAKIALVVPLLALRFTARPGNEPGMFVVRGAQLPIAGDWQLRIEVGRGEFELLTASVSVRVGEDF